MVCGAHIIVIGEQWFDQSQTIRVNLDVQVIPDYSRVTSISQA